MGIDLKIPNFILNTNLRPDIIIISEVTKQMGLVELTVPREDGIEVSNELKRTKYEPIVQDSARREWKTRIWAIEVGCRGFLDASVSVLLKDMGLRGREKKAILKEIGEEAENASSILWKCSRLKEWGKKNEKQK